MRPLILSIFALFLAGCTHSQQSMVDTFRASLFDNQDITVADQQIQALPYSTMYLRLNEGQRIFVVLGYIEQEQSKWLSQDNAMLVTHNGRLLKTVKLNNNLLEVTNSGQDPLRNALAIKDGSRWTRDILWSEDNHFRSATLSSTFSFAGLETLNIAGRNVLCNVWQEEVTSTRPEKQWQNTFWVDSATGQVRQSRQMLGAGVIPVEMTVVFHCQRTLRNDTPCLCARNGDYLSAWRTTDTFRWPRGKCCPVGDTTATARSPLVAWCLADRLCGES